MSHTQKVSQFYEEGLPEQAVYGFDIENASVEERERNDGEGTYLSMNLRFRLVEDKHGPIVSGDLIFDTINLYGRNLRRLTRLYKVITGKAPEGVVGEDGDLVIDFDAIADELKGGHAYGALTHRNRRTKQDDGTYVDTPEKDATFGWTFMSDIRKVKVPTKKEVEADEE